MIILIYDTGRKMINDLEFLYYAKSCVLKSCRNIDDQEYQYMHVSILHCAHHGKTVRNLQDGDNIALCIPFWHCNDLS